MTKAKSITWFTPPVGDSVGYGYAAISVIKALQDRHVAVWHKNNNTRTFVSFVQPDWYEGTGDQYRVGYTPWESDTIPEHWIEKMQAMDEIWTPSNYCKQVFEKYNVNSKIEVVPHGIDPEIWKIENRYETGKFIFLHVGGPTARKGGQRVVNAFLELFDGNPQTGLILKVNDETEARVTVNGEYGNAGNHPQIIVLRDKLTTDGMAELYSKASCLVYPTNGEGFGLIPFQGIATGLPTICTNATACKDFAEMSIPLDSKEVDGVGIHLGKWVEPSYDDLLTKMQYVYDNYSECIEKTINSARVIHSTQTWGHVADQVINILGDNIYSNI